MRTESSGPTVPSPVEAAAPRAGTRSLSQQLRLALIALAGGAVLVVVLALILITLLQGRASTIQVTQNQVVALRDDYAQTVERYFVETERDLNILVTVLESRLDRRLAYQAELNRAKAQAVERLFGTWQAEMRDVASDPDVVRALPALSAGWQAAAEPAALRQLYLARPALEDAGDGSPYSAAHREIHPLLASEVALHGYEDILLIAPQGVVVYSVQKSPLWGTDLVTGPYRTTALGQLYLQLKQAIPGQVMVADMAPLDGVMTLWMGAPVYNGAVLQGMVVYRLPLSALAELVQTGESVASQIGETYLVGRVGQSFTYRTDRFLDPAKMGDPVPAWPFLQLALDGVTGQEIISGTTGLLEMASYQPLKVAGLDWVIVTSGNLVELLSAQSGYEKDDFLTRYVTTYGYYDLLLIAPDGTVFYTVQREADLGTNLFRGDYQNTHLASLVRTVLRTGTHQFTDFAPYTPSNDAPAAFSAQLVRRGGQTQFVVALQLPWERLNALTVQAATRGQTWEVYVVGPDQLARTQLRLDSQPSLLQKSVATAAVEQALSGNAGYGAGVSYNGRPTFSAWQPLAIPGLQWALIAQVEQREALEPVNRLNTFTALLGGGLLILAALLSTLIATGLSRRLLQPLLLLTQTATTIAGGNLDAPLPELAPYDELEQLSHAFRQMATRLRETIASLQSSNQEVLARTAQLEANQRAVQVLFSVGRAVQTDELLAMVVNLIRDRFNLYHVQVYLLDEQREYAVLRQSTGFAGQQLLARKHRIPLKQTALVTTAILENRSILVADVRSDPHFLPNPLLPDTRSELTVPLRLEDQVIGVLDAQSRDVGFFTEDMITLFETMTEQIGLLFQSSQLYTEIAEKTEQLTVFTTQLATASEIARRLSTILDADYLLTEAVELLRSRFGLYHVHIYLLDEDGQALVVARGSGEVGRVLQERRHSIALTNEKSLVARAARERQSQLIADTALQSDFLPNPLLPQTRAELAVPLLVGPRVLGVLDMQDDQPQRFGPAERDTFTTLAGQLASALENARLFEAQKRAEQAIKDLARQNQLILNSAVEGIFGVDANGVTVFVNPAAVRMLGYSAEELLGGRHHDLIHHHRADGSHYPAEECKVYAAYRDGQTHTGEDEIYWRKDGTSFPVAYTSTPLKDEQGRILGAVVTFRDISEQLATRQMMEKRARELQTVAEVSTAVASLLNPDELLQRVVELTKANFNLYHAHIYLYDEANRTLRLAAGAGEAGRQMLAQGWQIPVDRETSLVARAFRTRQGVIENDVRAAPDFLPNPLLPETAAELAVPLLVGDRILGVLDVQSNEVGHFTELDVVIKTTLAEQIATALENARLYRETQGVADKLREVDRLKSEFLANMSHELRTPLNSILGYTQLLLLDLEGAIDEASYQDLVSIDVNGKHLLGLINDILDLAKIEAGRMELHLEELNVEPLLEHLKSSSTGLLHDKPVHFEVVMEPDLPTIYADNVRLTQVLNNLVSNAIKFTERGSVIVRAYREDGELCISVQDTGIGIREEDLRTIFERFRQVDGSFTRRAEGTGLGLPITQHLVHMHGGRLEVQSVYGQGSTFTVRLPVYQGPVTA